jgi:hypothetical protein
MGKNKKRFLKCAIATGVLFGLLYSFHSAEVKKSLARFDDLFANVSARDTPAATYDATAYQADLDETSQVLLMQ